MYIVVYAHRICGHIYTKPMRCWRTMSISCFERLNARARNTNRGQLEVTLSKKGLDGVQSETTADSMQKQMFPPLGFSTMLWARFS